MATSERAEEVRHQIVVTEDEWRLEKQVGDDWVICDRRDPADAAAFAVAEESDWFAVAEGTYTLRKEGGRG